MKTFIVFAGLFLAGISVLVYNGDMMNYLHERELMKATAEECAAGAALFTEDDAFANGQIVFDQEQGRAYAEGLLAYVVLQRYTDNVSRSYRVELSFEDDAVGYHENNPEKAPAVTAVVSVEGQDWFRLPALSVCEFKRAARYELEDES